MKNIMKFLAPAAAALMLLSCGGKGTGKVEMGPEDVVKAFNKAVTAGDFTSAKELCDTSAMKDYLDTYMEAWEVLQQEDSSALAIASSLLSGAVIQVEKVEKAEEGKAIYYTLEADGRSKTRKATVKKVEGAWRVESITDAV